MVFITVPQESCNGVLKQEQNTSDIVVGDCFGDLAVLVTPVHKVACSRQLAMSPRQCHSAIMINGSQRTNQESLHQGWYRNRKRLG